MEERFEKFEDDEFMDDETEVTVVENEYVSTGLAISSIRHNAYVRIKEIGKSKPAQVAKKVGLGIFGITGLATLGIIGYGFITGKVNDENEYEYDGNIIETDEYVVTNNDETNETEDTENNIEG